MAAETKVTFGAPLCVALLLVVVPAWGAKHGHSLALTLQHTRLEIRSTTDIRTDMVGVAYEGRARGDDLGIRFGAALSLPYRAAQGHRSHRLSGLYQRRAALDALIGITNTHRSSWGAVEASIGAHLGAITLRDRSLRNINNLAMGAFLGARVAHDLATTLLPGRLALVLSLDGFLDVYDLAHGGDLRSAVGGRAAVGVEMRWE